MKKHKKIENAILILRGIDKICSNCKYYFPDVGHGNEKMMHGLCNKPSSFKGIVQRFVHFDESCSKFNLDNSII